MKKLIVSGIAAALLAGCGQSATLPTAALDGMASFEAMGTDDVQALASKATMRKQMKAALEADAQALMAFADRDEDEKLSFDELQAKIPGFSRTTFRSRDKDHDGSLVVSEIVTEASVTLMTERVIRIRSGCVKALDKDRDRKLTPRDLQEAKQFLFDPQPWSAYAKQELDKLREAVLKDAFADKDVDANQDGKLDYDELYALFRFAIARGAMPLGLAKPQAPIL